jgi:pimeloyl-[acyl-carrier protein] synthase
MTENRNGVVISTDTRGIPLDNEIAAFYDSDSSVDPSLLYQRLLREAPVHRSAFGFWIIANYADASSILKSGLTARIPPPQSTEGSAMQRLNRGFLTRLDSPDHGRMRGLFRKAFSPREVSHYEDLVRTVVRQCIDKARSAGGFDVVKELADPLPAAMMNHLFAIPADDQADLASWLSTQSLANSPVGAPPWAGPTAEVASARLTEYLRDIIAKRRREPGADLLSVVLSATDGVEPATDEEILGVVAQLLQAGTTTTEVLLTQGLRALVRHPEQVARLRAEPALLNWAVEECLRYITPIRTMANRVATANLPLVDGVIPVGEELTVWIGTANRDPAVFADPDTLEITRSPNPHLAFSTGSHFCLGAHLARLEARVALGELIFSLPDLDIDEQRIVWGTSPLRPKIESMPVRF